MMTQTVEYPRALAGDSRTQQALTDASPPFGMYFINTEESNIQQWNGFSWSVVAAHQAGAPTLAPGQEPDREKNIGWVGVRGVSSPASAPGAGGGASGAAASGGGGGISPAPSTPGLDPPVTAPVVGGAPNFGFQNQSGGGMTLAGNVYNAGEQQVTPGVPFDAYHEPTFFFPSSQSAGNMTVLMQGNMCTLAGALDADVQVLIDGVVLDSANAVAAGGKGSPFMSFVAGNPFGFPAMPTGTHDVKLRFKTNNANTFGLASYTYLIQVRTNIS